MHKSKLLLLFRSLSIDEMKSLRKMVHSPFFTTNPHIPDLFKIIRKYHPQCQSTKLHKEIVFQKLFPSHPYSDIKLRKLMAEMTRIVEDFLINSELQNTAFQKKMLLSKIYGQRNLYTLFERETQQLLEHLDQLNTQESSSFHDRYQLLQQLFFHPDTGKHNANIMGIKPVMDNFDAYYVLEKLHLANEMRAREKVLNKRYDIKLLEEVIHTFQDASLTKQNPLYHAYLQMLQLHEEEGQSAFTVLKSYLLDESYALSKKARLNMLIQLLNFSIRQINESNSKFLQQNFELYKIGLQQKLLIDQNRITDSTFSNIVASGIRNQAFEWVSQFILDYEHLLEENLRPNVKTLCLGLLHYHQKNYERTINLISNFGFTNHFYQLRAKTLVLRAIFEKYLSDESFYPLFISQSQSFEKYLRRNKTIGDYKIEAHLAFIRLLRQLVKAKTKMKWNKTTQAKLTRQIIAIHNLAHKNWLLAKVEKIVP